MSARRGTWRAIGESVIGVTHERDGRPCQDYCGVHSSTPGAFVAAIADGHGQAKSFRSQVGARIAVEVATEVLLGFARSEAGASDDAFRVRKDLAGHLPRVVAQTWRERVSEHVERDPFTLDELTLVGDRYPIAPDQRMSPEACRVLWRAYGTTLLAVLVTGPYALALQIGDGLLMAAAASGGAFEVLDTDSLNFGTSTTSLSDEDAELRLRWRLIPHEGDYPILYWLCTDGYEKAFRSADLPGVCLEYRDAFRERDGWRVIQENLGEGLRQASARGTGDDATAAFLFFEEDHGSTPGDGASAVEGADGGPIPIESAGLTGSPASSSHDADRTTKESCTAPPARACSPASGDGGVTLGTDRDGVVSSEISEPRGDSVSEGGDQ
jgi:hypothetical protein